MDLLTAMQERKSARAYLDKPVPRAVVEKVLAFAGRAPSAINLQPWQFVVTYGEEKDRLVGRLQNARKERRVSCGPGTERPLPEKYAGRSRRALDVMEPAVAKRGPAVASQKLRANQAAPSPQPSPPRGRGQSLPRTRYGGEGGKPEVIEKLRPAFNRFIEEGSCSFYGAPIAVIVTIDRLFPAIRYLDVGLSVAYLMLAAHAEGLATCPIGLILEYADQIAEALNIPDDQRILLGLAMGYGDKASPVNAFKTDREELAEILTWYE